MVKPSKKVASGMVLLLLLLSVLGSTTHGDEPLESLILQRVAGEQNITVDRLEIGAMEGVALPLTGLMLYQAKVVDTATGEVTGLVVDGSGKMHSLEETRAAERAAYNARYGRLHPDLSDRLEMMSDGELLTVAVWLEASEITPLDRPVLEHQPSSVEQGDAELPPPEPGLQGLAEEKVDAGESEAVAARVAAIKAEEADRRAALEAAQQANLAHLQAQVATVQAPLLADLAMQGTEPIYVSPYAPLIYVGLPKSQILSLAQRADVDMVYGPNQNKDLMNSAKLTQKADIVDDWWGFDGSGIGVAILEDSRVEFNNPYLNAGTTRVPGDGNVDQHATATAGIVASQHGTYQGIAQGAYIYSANATNYGDANLSAAMDWAVSQGSASIINNSWGDPTGTGLNEHDRHLDYIVRHSARTVTVAAGNESDGCGSGTGKVTSPARGYNMISVGNYADQNTLTWDDDAMSACSSYVDPSTGIEKPEVAAVGSSINSTTAASPWVGNVGSGTSYSAPMVAGEAALLMERDSDLTIWPEAVKAIVMTTALHNIEGKSRLSAYDGAGGVDMRAAFRIVDEGWWDAIAAYSTSLPYNRDVWAYAGETVRAAIAWDSKPNAYYTTDPLEADIDLRVYDPYGGFVTSSISFDNSYEIVEFTATTTGSYALRVDDYRFDGSYEYIGVAWWPGHRVLTAYTPQVLAVPPTSRDYYRFNAEGDNHHWNAVGIRPASGSDHDLYLYANSAFGDPDDHDLLSLSDSGCSAVDLILVDGNHAPSGSYYPEVRQYWGTGNYAIEWATHSADTVGIYGPYTVSTSQVLRVWDSWFDTGVPKYIAVKPTSGDADLGMALYDSDTATASTWYQHRSQSVAYADVAGAGGAEYMNHQTATSDWLGLVVWNKGSTSTTTFYLYTDTTAPTGSVLVNGGTTYTDSTLVTLSLSANDAETGVAEMRFSNDGSTWSSWEPYAASKSWMLPSGEGCKTVYAHFRNRAGMVSAAYSDRIILDTVAPTGSVLINGGAAYATSTSVNLSLSASDSLSAVSQMRVGNSGGAWGPWEPYAASKSWTLVSGDGSKAVYVQYQDNAGNVSLSYSDSIILDITAPTGSISINGGATYASVTSVALSLSASDTTSGVADMRFSNDGSSWTDWEPYAANESWSLISGDGSKTVYAQYRDNVGHVSSSYSDSIILDTTAPTGSILIEGGTAYANSTSVALSLSASDGSSGVADMRFSDDGSSWTDWESYAASKSWMIPSGEGSKTVYVQYRDAVDNVSPPYSDSIILDTVAPTSSATSPPRSANVSFTVSWAGSDGLSGIASYDVQYRVESGGAWTDWLAGTVSTSATFGPASPVVVSRDQIYYFRVRARDNAGNLEAYPGGDGDSGTYVKKAFFTYLPVVLRNH